MIEQLIVGTPHDTLPRRKLGTDCETGVPCYEPQQLANFERTTGIKKTRHFVGKTAEMVKKTLAVANYNKGLNLKGIQQLIVITQSPDRLSPCMAAEIHAYLGLDEDVPAFDVNHACDGFVFGLMLANRMQRRTLLICADRLRYSPTPVEGLIFSDAVAVAIVNGAEMTPLMPFRSFTDGTKHGNLCAGLNGEMRMDGNDVFDFVTTKIPDLVHGFLGPELLGKIDWFVPHQANLSMNRILELRTGFKGRTLYSIEEYGNQSMCSIPTNIAVNEDKCLGKSLLLCGFGAGYTAALGIVTWPAKPICRMVSV